MKSFVITFCLFAMSVFAQVVTPIDGMDATALSKVCVGATLYTAANQPDLANLPAPYNQLIYAKQFTCTFPVGCLLCKVSMGLIENRLVNIGPGQRLFTVSLNGGKSESIDLFTLKGSQTPYQRDWIVPVYDRLIHLTFTASSLNAVLSILGVNDYAPPVQVAQAPPACLQVPANTIKANWSTMPVYLAHKTATAAMDCMPGLGLMTVVLDPLIAAAPLDNAAGVVAVFVRNAPGCAGTYIPTQNAPVTVMDGGWAWWMPTGAALPSMNTADLVCRPA